MADWETVRILRKKPQKASAMKTEQLHRFSDASEPAYGGVAYLRHKDPARNVKAVNRARREGAQIDTQQKWGGGQNKQHVTTKNTAKLDRETEELKHDKVPLDLGKLIQQGRQAKGWSQKDLATKCNEKPQVINDYEAGRGIPNQAVIGKIERALGVKLRGKDQGQPLQPPGTKM